MCGISVKAIILLVTAFQKFNVASDIIIFGIVGENQHLPCNLSDLRQHTIEWIDYVYNVDDEPHSIYSSENKESSWKDDSHVDSKKYKVEDDSSLIIYNLSFSDSGQYLCQSRLNSTVLAQFSYYLNIGTKLSCSGETDLADGQASVLSCQTDYVGSTHPLLQWSRGADKELDSFDEGDAGQARQVFNLLATPDDDGVNYTCRMMFGNFFVSCTKSLTVKYGVRDISFRPLKDVYEVGEAISCSAMGQPVPKVVISSTEGLAQSLEASTGYGTVVIPDQWLGKVIGLNCSGKNVINGKLYTGSSAHTFNVTGRHIADSSLVTDKNTFTNNSSPSKITVSLDTNKSFIIIGSIFAVGTVLLIIVAIVCMSSRKMENKNQKVSKPLLTGQPNGESPSQQQTTPV